MMLQFTSRQRDENYLANQNLPRMSREIYSSGEAVRTRNTWPFPGVINRELSVPTAQTTTADSLPVSSFVT